MFEFCEAKSGYVYNLEVYTGSHPTDLEHNMVFSVVDRLCDKIKGRGHCVYMVRWLCSPKIFNHLWGCKTKAVGKVMSNRKETPTQAFCGKLKMCKKYHANRITSRPSSGRASMVSFSKLLPLKVHLLRHHLQRRAHHKIKPAAMLDYNKYETGVDRSDQMLSYYSIERNTIKWWKKLFFHLFNLVVVNAHILHNKTSKKKSHWKFNTKNLLKDCSLVLVQKLRCKVRLASQLADFRDRPFYIYDSSDMLSWKENLSTVVVCVHTEAPDRENCKEMDYDVGLRIRHHTKLNYWELKKQLIFRGSAAKTFPLCNV
jgi:hypothetical protein